MVNYEREIATGMIKCHGKTSAVLQRVRNFSRSNISSEFQKVRQFGYRHRTVSESTLVLSSDTQSYSTSRFCLFFCRLLTVLIDYLNWKNTSNILIVKLNAYNFIVSVTVTLVLYTNYDLDCKDDDDDGYYISNCSLLIDDLNSFQNNMF